ncbi:MAG TPA: DUF1631 family protein [Noviherbaspirillum sp.]|jgi:hypothetical protein|uniref:DUF1631 family protein n=1 Tax=Noviherbaspirillum sp. TaxID=1926288 RepID=UPI002DDD1582|nr:DUF1631 family protein [Noviherbaspirillum sp.]HEV2610843.1 DUF1631 family protein [Noviherbaspirillum sp.]
MADTEYTRIFDLARERALYGFSHMIERTAQDADNTIMQAMAATRSMVDQKSLSVARRVLRDGGPAFLARMDTLFRTQLNRAMRTMYTDLRADVSSLSANDLSLIDDETVNRQIEVDRLLTRMRDADMEGIGRLNVIVAQMHGESEARERENPFRPYLIARSLHDAVKEVSSDENVIKVLFHHFSIAIIRHLPDYYASIRGAFESSGIRANMVVQPSKMTPNQRYFGGLDVGSGASVDPVSASALSGMQHLFALLGHASFANGMKLDDLIGGGQPASLQEMMRRLFSPSGAGNAGGAAGAGIAADKSGSSGATADESDPEGGFADALPVVQEDLFVRLDRYQAMVVEGKSIDEQLSPEQNQLFKLREQLGPNEADESQQMVIDIVAVLFEFLLGDEKIPTPLRTVLSRLQIPFLKAALLEPKLLQELHHPARELLNRLCTVAIGSDLSERFGGIFGKEAGRIVYRILSEFKDDVRVFAKSLEGLEEFLEKHLPSTEDGSAQCIDALKETERQTLLGIRVARSLKDLIMPLRVEQRVAEFITGIWSRVLVQTFLHEQSDAGGPHPDISHQEARDMVSDLIWSVQEKQNPQEHSMLMRLLPQLAKRLRAGLQSIQLPEEEAKQALDHLVSLHMQVMRPSPATRPQRVPTLEELRGRFSLLVIDWKDGLWIEGETSDVPASILEPLLRRHGVTASLFLEREALLPLEEGIHFLNELQPGGSMKYLSAAGDNETLARLVWISPRRLLYLFRLSADGQLLIYASASLLQSLLEGKLRPVERAPLFDRAAQSIMATAAAVQQADAVNQ